MNKYGSRKFIIALYVQTTAFISLALGLLDGGQFVSLAGGVVLLYNGANVLQKKAVEKNGTTTS